MIEDFSREFTLVAMSIPRLKDKPVEWNLSFDTIHDVNHQVTVELIDYKPSGVIIDG